MRARAPRAERARAVARRRRSRVLCRRRLSRGACRARLNASLSPLRRNRYADDLGVDEGAWVPGKWVHVAATYDGAHRRLSAKAPVAYLHTTPTLLTAQVVSLLLFIIFLCGFCCLFSLQTPRKFEEPKAA